MYYVYIYMYVYIYIYMIYINIYIYIYQDTHKYNKKGNDRVLDADIPILKVA